MSVRVGDVVAYWSRQPGKPRRLVVATVTALSPNGHWATVQRDGTYRVRKQTVDARRLRKV